MGVTVFVANIDILCMVTTVCMCMHVQVKGQGQSKADMYHRDMGYRCILSTILSEIITVSGNSEC